ncbi:MAG: DUF4160 domain-containing protein [Aeromonas sp.]
MPTIFLIYGLRVVIYPNDHDPSHVHVIGNGCEAIFNLTHQQPPELRENYGFDSKTLRRIFAELIQRNAEILAQWENIHGTHR